MENLTTLLAFIQQEHKSIKSVLFKHCEESIDSCFCEISFNKSLSTSSINDRHLLIATINTFVVTFGAIFHGDCTSDSIKLLIHIKFNK